MGATATRGGTSAVDGKGSRDYSGRPCADVAPGQHGPARRAWRALDSVHMAPRYRSAMMRNRTCPGTYPYARPGHSQRVARISPAVPAGQDLGNAHQATHQPARPRTRVHARRCRRVRRDRPRPGRGAQPHRARQPDRRGHQRHRGAGARGDRPARGQAGDGRQGGAVQEVRRTSIASTSRSTNATPTSWSTSSRRSSRPSAASTSRTSRRRSASTSSASCASG